MRAAHGSRAGVYFITDHYRSWRYVLVRLAMCEEALRPMLERTWRDRADAPSPD